MLFVDGILLVVGNPDKDDIEKMAEQCSCPVNAELCLKFRAVTDYFGLLQNGGVCVWVLWQ